MEISTETHKGLYSRGYLPHIDVPTIQFITFRLQDSFPRELLESWKSELNGLEPRERRREEYRRLERYVDLGHGECFLGREEIASAVEFQLQFHDGLRYDLLSWTIMPNHVHVLVRLRDGAALGKVIQSWKARSARRANELLGRTGPFWSRDYFDRYVRDETHLTNCIRYIDENPVKAGLCALTSEWPYGSARLAVKTAK